MPIFVDDRPDHAVSRTVKVLAVNKCKRDGSTVTVGRTDLSVQLP